MYTHTCVRASVSVCMSYFKCVPTYMPLVHLGRRVSTLFQKRLFTLPGPASDFSCGSVILSYEQSRINNNDCNGINNIAISLGNEF